MLFEVVQTIFELLVKNSKRSKNVRIMAIYDRKLSFDGSSIVEMLAGICQHYPAVQVTYTYYL